MNELFAKEEQLLAAAEELLRTHAISDAQNEKSYRTLYEGYRRLLKQMMRVVKMSDMMQLELRNLSERLERMAQIDPLTEMYNKRFFNDAFQREWKSALRTGSPLALLMVDIDHFKRYNDTYGHLQGDECLKAVASEIRQAGSRPRDVAARFGGEEFIVLLPETDAAGATHIGTGVLERIRSLDLEHCGLEVHGRVTVSLGVTACIPTESDSMDAMVRRADSALYAAKSDGRNCLRVDS